MDAHHRLRERQLDLGHRAVVRGGARRGRGRAGPGQTNRVRLLPLEGGKSTRLLKLGFLAWRVSRKSPTSCTGCRLRSSPPPARSIEKAAKAAGERDEAARIHSLAKPTVTAWLANQLAREHRDELEPLLELGAGLRDATRNLAGDQLRALSRQQHELVHALVQQARALARAAGRSLSEDTVRGLEETLRAALADEEAASLLLAGRLTDALHSSDFDTGFGSGFGSTDADVIPITRHAARSSGDSAGRRQPGEERPGRRPTRDDRLRQADDDLIDAQRALANATSARDDAQARVDDADQAAAEAHERLEELRQQLEEASTAAADADRARREHANALQQAERAIRNAERRTADAQSRRDRIATDD